VILFHEGRKCESPRVKRNRLPIGIDFIQETAAGIAAKRRPLDIRRDYDKDRDTYVQYIFGSRIIFTGDPRNIQHMYAKKVEGAPCSHDFRKAINNNDRTNDLNPRLQYRACSI
jgi:hypothetical protein